MRPVEQDERLQIAFRQRHYTDEELREELILEEKLAALRCKNSFLAWCIEALAPFNLVPAKHHRLLISELQDLVDGNTAFSKLMIFMPPGSAKSTYVSKLLPAWLYAHIERCSIIGASHTSKLAHDFSGEVQGFVRNNTTLLGYGLQTENIESWRTTNGGVYISAGVNGAISGRRADIAIVDDPIKNRKEADSPTYRDTNWKWWHGDLMRRLRPNGKAILMHTRWHEDDLAGRLLNTQGELWRVIELPAIADSDDDALHRRIGDPIWNDDNYGYGAKLYAIRDELERAGRSREWSSQYQQKPRPPEGVLFKVGKIPEVAVSTLGYISWVRAWDLAATKDTGANDADFTAGVKLGKTTTGHYIIGDVVRFRGDPAEVLETIKSTAARDGVLTKIGLPQDPGQSGKQQIVFYTTELAGYTIESSPESGDKATRAGPVAAQTNVGNLSIAAGDPPWKHALIEELRSFPVGEHDDQVDALSRAFGMLVGDNLSIWAGLGRAA